MSLTSWNDLDLPRGGRVYHWQIDLTDRDAMLMSREQLAMIEDGLWLIDQAIRGERQDGPLTLPKTRLPVRT